MLGKLDMSARSMHVDKTTPLTPSRSSRPSQIFRERCLWQSLPLLDLRYLIGHDVQLTPRVALQEYCTPAWVVMIDGIKVVGDSGWFPHTRL